MIIVNILTTKYRKTQYKSAKISSKEISKSLDLKPIIKEQRIQRRIAFFDETYEDDSYII